MCCNMNNKNFKLNPQMRVISCNGTWQRLWVGAWAHNFATLTHVTVLINVSTVICIAALMQHRSPDQLPSIMRMASSRSFTPVLPPPRFSCSPVAAENSSRTSTGRRCSIVCYIELAPGLHISQSTLCHLGLRPPIVFSPTQRDFPPLTSVPLHSASRSRHPALRTMPQL